MKTIITIFTALFCLSVNAQQITGMWTFKEGDKIKVFNISDTEIETSETDLSFAAFATNEKIKIKKNIPGTDLKSGRFIVTYANDSLKKTKVLDYLALSADSVLIIESEESFDNSDAAEKSVKSKAKPKTFYSNEFMFKQAIIKKMPVLTKDQYMSFLRDVNTELKKPGALVKNKPDPEKTIDEQMEAYMEIVLQNKKYKGKIIPETLKIASVKYKDDAAVKKFMPMIKVNFAKRPGGYKGAKPVGSGTKTPPTATKK